MSSSVQMKDNATSHIQIKYYSRCKSDELPQHTSKCTDFKVGDVIDFEAEIIALSCPENPAEWNQTIKIYPVGIDEGLVINVELLCSCPCDKPGHPFYEPFSEKCNFHGTSSCGMCICDKGFVGRNCECSEQELHSNNKTCRREDDLVDCSGRGNCVCGVCECNRRNSAEEIITGEYCECDNFSCARHGGLLCSGPQQGTCECNKCSCKPGWMGIDCSCRNRTDTCRPGKTGDFCSGHGECVCGECVCETTKEGRYSGRYCDKCPTCPGRCQEFKDCVQCQTYKSGPLAEEPGLCAKNCTLFTPIEVEKVEILDEKDEHICTFYDEKDCKFQFVYNDRDEDHIIVRAQAKKECPPEIFILSIILSVIALIVLIGLAILLLWKLFTTIHDRREFARFEKERMMAKWDTVSI